MRNALTLIFALGLAVGANAQLASPAPYFEGQIENDEEQTHTFDIEAYCFVDVDGDLNGLTNAEDIDYGTIAPAGAGDNFATQNGIVGYGTNTANCDISAEASLPAALDGELAFQIALGGATDREEAAGGDNGSGQTRTWGEGGAASGASQTVVTGVTQNIATRPATFTVQVSDVALAGDDYVIDVLYTVDF